MSSTSLTLRTSPRIKKVEKPRPLKSSTSGSRNSFVEGSTVLDNILSDLEYVCHQLNSCIYDRSVISSISNLCNGLRIYGAQMENLYADQLDKSYVILRNACRDNELDIAARIHLLEIIELRAQKWQLNENVASYYKHKFAEIEYNDDTDSICVAPQQLQVQNMPTQSMQQTTNCLLIPGEVVKESGKYSKPTKIPGKNYFKDEVVIRNSDSGKVMGIKGRRVHTIEELSETVISFQRVYPGAKERLVQITGPNQESISSAKTLIEETILRNASPVRNETLSGSTTSLNSSASDESHNIIQRPPYQHSISMPEDITREYKHTVKVGNNYIKLCGDNNEMVQAAKVILDEYFCAKSDANVNNDIIRKPFLTKTNFQDQIIRTEEGKGDADTKIQGTTGTPKRVMYPREFLIKCSISPLCSKTPNDWSRIVQEIPDISRKPQDSFDGQQYLRLDWKGDDLTVLNLTESETD